MNVRWMYAVLLAAVMGAAGLGGGVGTAQDLAGYLLGPGDALNVVVYGQPDLSETVTIKPDGMISLPLVNAVRAAGLTTSQLEADLAKRYATYLKQPLVTVTVSQLRAEHVYVLGQVARPGDYPLRPGGTDLLELIASAGGPTTRADLAKAVIIRGKTRTIPLDLPDVIAGKKSLPTELRPNDVLYIPETDPRIVVLGQVNKPGSYNLLPGQHVSDLIAAAGGVTQKAGLAKAFLVRGAQQTPIDLQAVLDGNTATNIALQPGDMVVVPESTDYVAVLGGVTNPGRLLWKQNMTVVDAIAMAGGKSDKGRLNKVAIVRRGADGKTKTVTVNVQAAVQGKDMSQNVPLQSGDIVYVPTGLNFQVGDLLGILYFIAGPFFGSP